MEAVVSSFVAVTMFFFGPLEIVLSEPAEFWFSVADIFGLVFGCTIICFMILMSILFVASQFGERAVRAVSSIIAAFGFGLYIQGNWTFVSYGSMDGTAIDWGNYTEWAIIDTLIWIGIFTVIIWMFNFKVKFNNLYSLIMLGIIGIEGITLGTLYVSTIGAEPKADYSFVGGGEFQLSSNNKNIIVILADGFDGIDFLPILEEEPGFRSYFDGFTFYEDTCGTSLYSEESGVTLLTGNQMEVGYTFNENIRRAYTNSNLYDVLKENNYEIYLYLQDEKMVSPEIARKVINYSGTGAGIDSISNAFNKIYQMVAFRYVPHVLKKYFWYSSMELLALKGGKKTLYYNYDVYDYIQKQGIITEENDKNIYQFYWIQGPHEPANTDRYCKRVEKVIEMKTDEYADSQFEQAIGVVRMYTELIEELKKAGVYDNTTIIFTADHGWDVRPNPMLLIKPFDSHGELVISEAPVSMIEDYLPTLEYFISENKVSEGTIYELSENQERERVLYIYDTDDGIYNSRKEIYYSEGAFTGRIILDKELSPNDIGSHAISGFSSSEGSRIWTGAMENEIEIKVSEEIENLQMDLDYMTYNGIQPVEIYVNNNLVARYVAYGAETKSIIIPNEYVKDKKINIRFTVPYATMPTEVDAESTDSRMLALSFYGMTFSSTDREFDIKAQVEDMFME